MTTEFERPLYGHSAVYQDNYMMIIGGIDINNKPLSTRLIWMYNLYTEAWCKHVIPNSSAAPEPFSRAVAAVVDGAIYTFGRIKSTSLQ